MDLPNYPPSFLAQRSSMKRFVEWKCLALLSSEEISNKGVFLYKNIKKDLLNWYRINSHWDTSCLVHCRISNIKIAVLH